MRASDSLSGVNGGNTYQDRCQQRQKEQLIANLNDQVYTGIRPTQVAGGKEVGVFALKRIPKDTNPFGTCNMNIDARQHEYDQIVWLSSEEVEQLSSKPKELVKKFCVPPPKSEMYPIPAKGLNSIDISFYCNTHFDKKRINLRFDKEEEDERGMSRMLTTRVIEAGEELFAPYTVHQHEICSGCGEALSEVERSGAVTQCKCKVSNKCIDCTVKWFRLPNNIHETFNSKNKLIRRSATCPTCNSAVSKTFLEMVLFRKGDASDANVALLMPPPVTDLSPDSTDDNSNTDVDELWPSLLDPVGETSTTELAAVEPLSVSEDTIVPWLGSSAMSRLFGGATSITAAAGSGSGSGSTDNAEDAESTSAGSAIDTSLPVCSSSRSKRFKRIVKAEPAYNAPPILSSAGVRVSDSAAGADSSKHSQQQRPPGGQPGLAYMQEDRKWIPVSIDVEKWVSAAERNKQQMKELGRVEVVHTRGMTPFRFYEPRTRKDSTDKNGKRRAGTIYNAIATDYFSDGDVSIKRISTTAGVADSSGKRRKRS